VVPPSAVDDVIALVGIDVVVATKAINVVCRVRVRDAVEVFRVIPAIHVTRWVCFAIRGIKTEKLAKTLKDTHWSISSVAEEATPPLSRLISGRRFFPQ